MEKETYTTYEAKARFSELLRKVSANKRIIITRHGVPVAELGPIQADPESLEHRLRQMAEAGSLQRAATQTVTFPTLAERPGALARFLDDRD